MTENMIWMKYIQIITVTFIERLHPANDKVLFSYGYEWLYSLYMKHSYWKFVSLNYLHMSDLTIYHSAFYLLSKLIYDNYIMTSEKRSTPFLFCQSSTFVISESYHLFSFDNNKQIFRLYSSAFEGMLISI